MVGGSGGGSECIDRRQRCAFSWRTGDMWRCAPSSGALRLRGVQVQAALAMALDSPRGCRDHPEQGHPRPWATLMTLEGILEAVVVALLAVLVVPVVVVVVVAVLGRRSTPPSWRPLLRLRRSFWLPVVLAALWEMAALRRRAGASPSTWVRRMLWTLLLILSSPSLGRLSALRLNGGGRTLRPSPSVRSSAMTTRVSCRRWLRRSYSSLSCSTRGYFVVPVWSASSRTAPTPAT